jgi:hypothetical protein
MTQILYAHMNKIKIIYKKEIVQSIRSSAILPNKSRKVSRLSELIPVRLCLTSRTENQEINFSSIHTPQDNSPQMHSTRFLRSPGRIKHHSLTEVIRSIMYTLLDSPVCFVYPAPHSCLQELLSKWAICTQAFVSAFRESRLRQNSLGN